MAQTRQGAFDKTYHHIDAPTYQDDEYGKEYKRRILLNPHDHRPDVQSKISVDLYNSQYQTKEIAYLWACPWTVKRKLDGENIRIYWDGEQALWNGKSNNFQCSAEFQNYMNNTFIEEIFEEKFGREKEVYIYGEHMGPKVQGNELGLDKDELVILDVEINGTFLDKDGIINVASYFGVKSVYDYMDGALASIGEALDPIESSLEYFIWEVAEGELSDWEGIVCTPACNIKDHNGKRIIVKIKNKDYNRDWRKNA